MRYSHHRRWNARRSYYNYVRNTYRDYVYLNWILYPSTRLNGHYYVDNYPYYVHNGYRHRYSNTDYCSYQLVNKYTHDIVKTYGYQSCVSGYNRCAIDRDRKNERAWENKYFCAETYRELDGTYYRYEDSDDYDYDDDYYYDEDDYYYDEDAYCDDYDYNSNVCRDIY
jgi:hypothetical protein